jgi:DNA end-binding protein Ku
MPRAIWSGAVSFGLVNVPIKLVTATSSKDIRFNQLHETDGGRINQKRVCSVDGEEVDYSEIVKGYDLGGGRYVIIDPEELRSIDPEASRTIDIEEFVDLAEIDPIYFEHTYYLVPEDRAVKPYALLVDAMAGTGKVALGKFVLRSKQYLAALRPKDGVLVLSTLLFADEVISTADLDVPTSTKTSDRELAMAKQLVESLSAPFDLTKYRDDYRERVMELIEQKAEGVEITQSPESAPVAPVVDLMAALEASLAAARAAKAEDQDGKGKPSRQQASA